MGQPNISLLFFKWAVTPSIKQADQFAVELLSIFNWPEILVNFSEIFLQLKEGPTCGGTYERFGEGSSFMLIQSGRVVLAKFDTSCYVHHYILSLSVASRSEKVYSFLSEKLIHSRKLGRLPPYQESA